MAKLTVSHDSVNCEFVKDGELRKRSLKFKSKDEIPLVKLRLIEWVYSTENTKTRPGQLPL